MEGHIRSGYVYRGRMQQPLLSDFNPQHMSHSVNVPRRFFFLQSVHFSEKRLTVVLVHSRTFHRDLIIVVYLSPSQTRCGCCSFQCKRFAVKTADVDCRSRETAQVASFDSLFPPSFVLDLLDICKQMTDTRDDGSPYIPSCRSPQNVPQTLDYFSLMKANRFGAPAGSGGRVRRSIWKCPSLFFIII